MKDKELEKQIKSQIESAAASLLDDDEICTSLNITPKDLEKHYEVVENARLKIKQRLNAKRILNANNTGEKVEDIIKDIPENTYKRKKPKTATKEVEGVVVGRGENKTVVPPEEVYKLAKLWCSMQEIADWFNIPRETLKYNFSDLIAKGRAETKQALRRAQLKNALGGNTSMQIWLGKNILGQSDNPINNESVQVLPWLEEDTD